MTSAADSSNRLSPLKRAYLALEKVQARLESLERRQREAIAVLGMGCRYPGGANNPDEFWRLLADGRDAITEVPASRWDVDEYYDPDPDAPCKIASRYGGFIDGVDQFDAAFFGISPREAESLDPQQRLLLEATLEAFEDAGIAADSLINSETGVFMGLANGDYYCLVTHRACSKIDAYLGTGTSPNAAAGRLSYVFGLRGPCVAIDTACSSSLVAVHLACQSLRNGECDMAIAGGVNVMLAPELSITFSKARMLCPDGRCKTFDAAANGYVRGEGVGVIVLKRLPDALAAGDRVLAVVRGSAINQDGPSGGLTVPNGPSQQDVIRRALAIAGIPPEEVGYLEAHGTGTALGDPIEMGAIGAVFGRRADSLWVGSLKTNVGHLEGAAGIAGVMKVVLALQHEQIPPHLHFHTPSPRIAWSQLPVRVATELSPWPRGRRRRAAGVSSFGFSGINAHVVLEEAPAAAAAEKPQRPRQLLTLSAKHPDALRELARRYADRLEADAGLQLSDVCFTAAVGRAHREHRAAVAAGSIREACQRLRALARNQPAEGLFVGSAETTPPKVAFLFSGEGAQYAGMGRQLDECEPVFRAALDACEAVLRDNLETPLRDVLYGAAGIDLLLRDPAHGQASVFALEYALWQLWQSWGVRPAAVLGYGVGEYAAACAAKVFSVEDALRLVAARGRLARESPSGGRVAIVSPGQDRASEGLADLDRYPSENADHARRGSPDPAAVAGRRSPSTSWDRIFAPFRSAAETVTYAEPQVRLISSVTGGPVGEEIVGPQYWCEQLRGPDRFSLGVTQLLADGIRTFLELGPQAALVVLARESWDSARRQDSVRWLSSLQPDRTDWPTLLESLAELYVSGQSVNWENFCRGFAGKRISLPTYPFQRRRYWIEPSDADVAGPTAAAAGVIHPLLGRRLHSACAGDWVQFECLLSSRRPRFLRDHRIAGSAVLPASAYMEIALAAARHATPHQSPMPDSQPATHARRGSPDPAGTADRRSPPAFSDKLQEPIPNSHRRTDHLVRRSPDARPVAILEDLALDQAMPLPDGLSRVVQLAVKPDGSAYRFELYSRIARDDPQDARPRWTLHATGRLVAADGLDPVVVDLASLKARCSGQAPLEEFNRRMAAYGLEYGPAFHGLQRLWRGESEVLGEVELPGQLAQEAKDYLLYPPLLDACLQAAAMLVDPRLDGAAADGALFVPVGLERLLLLAALPARLWSHARLRQVEADGSQAADGYTMDVDLIDPSGAVAARVQGLKARRVAATALAAQWPAAEGPPQREGAPPPELDADALRRLPVNEQRRRIGDFLETELVRILKLPRHEPIARDANLFELGMDSLMAVEFLYRANRGLRTNLPMERLLANAAVNRLADEFTAELHAADVGGRSVQPASAPQPTPAPTAVPTPSENVWFPDHQPAPNARVRLFCFHPPGASASAYSRWPELLRPDTEVWAMQLPGSGSRSDEPELAPWRLLVETAADEVLEHLDRPFAFFGYGGASLLALDVARSVRQRFGLAPVHLFVAARALEDAQADPRGSHMVGFAVRPPLDCPITALAPECDDRFGDEELARWSALTEGGFRLVQLPGDLAALLQAPEPLLRIIAEDLRQAIDR